jgi:hypothetical protein
MGSLRQTIFGKTAGEQALWTKSGRQGRSARVFPTKHSTNYDGGVSENIGEYYATKTDSGSAKINILSIPLSSLRGTMGQRPIVLTARLYFWYHSGIQPVFLSRMINLPTWGDWTNRYRTLSTTIAWNDDDDSAYMPFPGVDIPDAAGANEPNWERLDSKSGSGFADTTVPTFFFSITEEFAARLLRSQDLNLIMYGTADAETRLKGPTLGMQYNPFLDIKWLYEIEFYHCVGGEIDITQRVGNDIETGFYLGAVDRGETGTPIKYAIRNLSTEAKAIVELIDDHPEYTDPVQSSGAGTGNLDFIEPTEPSVSQQYQIKILPGAATFEVVGLANGDYAISLHPTFDATGSWQGTVGTDWTAPVGGLHIPGEAWQAAGLAADDLFVSFVRGNTTDVTWPADSNEQAQMCGDSAGSPDGNWRKINGRRARTRASVTVDATTKMFPIQPCPPAEWEVGAEAFVFDDDTETLQEGNVASAGVATIGADAFTGSGLDDLSLSGNYNGVEWWDTLQIEIDATGTPDTFSWSKDGGSTTEATGIAITGAAQLLEAGVYATFVATTGHTLGDLWDSNVNPFYVELENLTANSDIFPALSRVGTSLPITTVDAAVWGRSSDVFGLSETPANRIPIVGPAGLGFAGGNTIIVQSVTTPTLTEEHTIDTVGAAYIDVSATAFADDYEAGAVVWKKGTGVRYFHKRPVATLTTTEQEKRYRFNTRT